jgi:hypothetical protein
MRAIFLCRFSKAFEMRAIFLCRFSKAFEMRLRKKGALAP